MKSSYVSPFIEASQKRANARSAGILKTKQKKAKAPLSKDEQKYYSDGGWNTNVKTTETMRYSSKSKSSLEKSTKEVREPQRRSDIRSPIAAPPSPDSVTSSDLLEEIADLSYMTVNETKEGFNPVVPVGVGLSTNIIDVITQVAMTSSTSARHSHSPVPVPEIIEPCTLPKASTATGTGDIGKERVLSVSDHRINQLSPRMNQKHIGDGEYFHSSSHRSHKKKGVTRSTSPLDERVLQDILGWSSGRDSTDEFNVGFSSRDRDEPSRHEYKDILNSVATMMDAVSTIVQAGSRGGGVSAIPPYPGLASQPTPSKRHSFQPLGSARRRIHSQTNEGTPDVSHFFDQGPTNISRNIKSNTTVNLFQPSTTQGGALPLTLPMSSPDVVTTVGGASFVSKEARAPKNTNSRRHLSEILGGPGSKGVVDDKGESFKPTNEELADKIVSKLHSMSRLERESQSLLQKPVRRYASMAVAVDPRVAASERGATALPLPDSSSRSRSLNGTIDPRTALKLTTDPPSPIKTAVEIESEAIGSSSSKVMPTMGLVEFEVDENTGEVVLPSYYRYDLDAQEDAMKFLQLRPTRTAIAPSNPVAVNSDATFLASLQPGGLTKSATVIGAAAAASEMRGEGGIKPLPFLLQVEAPDDLRYTIAAYKREIKSVQRLKEVAFRQRGVTLGQTITDIGDTIFDELVGEISDELEDFFESYADTMLEKL